MPSWVALSVSSRVSSSKRLQISVSSLAASAAREVFKLSERPQDGAQPLSVYWQHVRQRPFDLCQVAVADGLGDVWPREIAGFLLVFLRDFRIVVTVEKSPSQFDVPQNVFQPAIHDKLGLSGDAQAVLSCCLHLMTNGLNRCHGREDGEPAGERTDPFPHALNAAVARWRSCGHSAQHGYGRSTDDQDQSDRCEIRHGLIGALPKVVTRIHVSAPRYLLLRPQYPLIRLSNCIELSVDCCFHQVERCRARADAAQYCHYFSIVRRRCECTREQFDGRCCRLNIVVTPAPSCSNGNGDLGAAVDAGKRSSQGSAPQKVVEYWRAWVFRCRLKQIVSTGLGAAIILHLRQQAFQVTLDPSVARTSSCFEVCFLLVNLISNCGNCSGRTGKCECPGYQRLPIIDETTHAVAGASRGCCCVRPCPHSDQHAEPKTDDRTDCQPENGLGKWNDPIGVLAQWSESKWGIGKSRDIWRRSGRLGNLVAAPSSKDLFGLSMGGECVG